MSAVELYEGDNRNHLRRLIDQGVQVHSVVTDPPYHLESIQKRFGKVGSAAAKFGTNGAFQRASAGFCGASWDGADVNGVRIAFDRDFWQLAYDILLPGGYLLSFSAARTYHRMATAIEDAGFVIHPLKGWIYGSGMPKPHSASRAIDQALGLKGERNNGIYVPVSTEAAQWDGWAFGSAIKPALEPICFAQKPISEKTYGANMLKHGIGSVHIDACRAIGDRYPSNVIHDDSDDILACFPQSSARFFNNFPATDAERFLYNPKPGKKDRVSRHYEQVTIEWISEAGSCQVQLLVDMETSPPRVIAGSESTIAEEWSTFLFGSTTMDLFQQAFRCTTKTKISSTTKSTIWNCWTHSLTRDCTVDANSLTENGSNLVESAEFEDQSLSIMLAKMVSLPGANRATLKTPLKISVSEKLGIHPTRKPVSLMQWLCRLVTPPGGTVLDPFAGSGTTGEAANREGFHSILMEADPQFADDIRRRFNIEQDDFDITQLLG